MASHIRRAISNETVEPTIIRRNANYSPPTFDYDFVQSLMSDYSDDKCTRRIEQLTEKARCLLGEAIEPFARLELIDVLQRLGLAYLFESEIRESLDAMSNGKNDVKIEKDLNATAIRFRLLRQYGFEVSQDVFNSFMDDKHSFKACLSEDIKGILSLYEASHLGFTGEAVLDEAKVFTTKHLKQIKQTMDPYLAKQVQHALELPMRYMMPRLYTRWYIEEAYEKEKNMKPFLLELATLDYNRLQALYQCNIKEMSRWWRELGTMEKLPFTRDRVVECFLFALGVAFHPQYQYSRNEVTKVNQLITMIDDVYDLYGTLDEIKLFTDAVERWDTDAIEDLPEYMKICYMVLFNTINSLGYDTLRDQGVNIIPCLRKLWADICNAYLTEAKWYHSGYNPTFEEYLNNAWVSISGPIALAHGYFSMRLKVTDEVLECLENYHDLIRWSAMTLRLCDDWGTSTHEIARGDVLKVVESYMHESGVSEAVARKHVRGMIDETWKKLNKECVGHSPFPRPFINGAIGLAQVAECVYQFGDGFGCPHDGAKARGRVIALLVDPIPLKEI
ncbi:alpha-terpineol synthase, chloroplastic-like [Magnolia sinica]|uniref:alpha-terpineol synthase, chloroplastic-like n=1 Tax=Magnolia sinica TaxID=86752 RepID=UPI0026582692|nr:alpha-terpineol synthase, chloroplastic-like [Magnolia sinica]